MRFFLPARLPPPSASPGWARWPTWAGGESASMRPCWWRAVLRCGREGAWGSSGWEKLG